MSQEVFIKKIWYNLNNSNDIATVIDGKKYTYSDLRLKVWQQMNLLNDISSPRIGIFLDDSIEMYASILACWFSKKAYVPVNQNYPINRIREIIEIADLTVFIGSRLDRFSDLEKEIRLIEYKSLSIEFEEPQVPDFDLTTEAYVLFTSGTSGKPKGVPISQGNLQSFFNGFFNLNYSLSREDRFLQMFELTFDLSVMSFSIPLILGSSFYPIDKKIIKPLALYKVLSYYKITFALMVPSVVNMLEKYKEDIDLIDLKYTQFCGEAFKIEQLKTWIECAPHSQIDNVYGPTEATIYCSRYTAYPISGEPCHRNGILSIGNEMIESKFFLDKNGILNLGGNQISKGYLKPNKGQSEKFHSINNVVYFVSGDLGLQQNNEFFCLGREDDQVKIQGFRVELSELEYGFNRLYPEGKSVAIAKNLDNGTVLYLIIQKDSIDSTNSNQIFENLKIQLPEYMIPKKIIFVNEFPLNQNGKIDKKQLLEWIN